MTPGAAWKMTIAPPSLSFRYLASIHRVIQVIAFRGPSPSGSDLGVAVDVGFLPLTFLRLVRLSLPGMLAGVVPGGPRGP